MPFLACSVTAHRKNQRTEDYEFNSTLGSNYVGDRLKRP
jgi:hypothetical protein